MLLGRLNRHKSFYGLANQLAFLVLEGLTERDIDLTDDAVTIGQDHGGCSGIKDDLRVCMRMYVCRVMYVKIDEILNESINQSITRASLCSALCVHNDKRSLSLSPSN